MKKICKKIKIFAPLLVAIVITVGACLSIASTSESSEILDLKKELAQLLLEESNQPENDNYEDLEVEDTSSKESLDESSEEESEMSLENPSVNIKPSGSTSVGKVTESGTYKDGTYYGTATGFAGPLTVCVGISNQKINSIRITSTKDDASFIQKASAVISKIVSRQTTNVDTVSGATYSSAGIIKAVRQALSKASVTDTGSSNNESSESEEETSSDVNNQDTKTMPYPEGVYFGTAKGFNDDITIAIVIQDYRLKNIVVISHEDDEAFFGRARELLNQMIHLQTVDVDTVTGATYSSNGLIDAVKEALKEAQKAADALKNENSENDEKETLDESEKIEESEKVEESEESETVVNPYKDGTYCMVVLCEPDEDHDFESYQLSVKIVIQNGKIVDILSVSGDGSEDNDSYIQRALNGTKSKPGMKSKLINLGDVIEIENVDTVSRATCTSKSIKEACIKAIEASR